MHISMHISILGSVLCNNPCNNPSNILDVMAGIVPSGLKPARQGTSILRASASIPMASACLDLDQSGAARRGGEASSERFLKVAHAQRRPARSERPSQPLQLF
jgi:hypothetical protein